MRRHTPYQVSTTSKSIPDILELLQRSFAYMESRINPPSSVHELSNEAIKASCETGEVWAIGKVPFACIFLKVKKDRLYIGKLAVEENKRGQGFSKTLLTLAENRAQVMGLSGLELETRIELLENHVTFRKLGFEKKREGSHDGFSKSTFIVMRKDLKGDRFA